MSTFIVSENPRYWTAATTNEMIRRNIWVCDIGRPDKNIRNRAERIIDGLPYIIIKDMGELTDTVKDGDILQMLVRDEKAIYQGIVTGPPTFRLVNTHEHKEGEFYSLPVVVESRRRLYGEPIMGCGPTGYGGLSNGYHVEVQIPVEWSRTTIPVSRQPHATIKRAV